MRVFFLIALMLMAGCRRSTENMCPIDGQAAQWQRPAKGGLCEYSHYNDVERTTHSWLAACTHDESK